MFSRSAAMLALSIGLSSPAFGQNTGFRPPDDRPTAGGSTSPARPDLVGGTPAATIDGADQTLTGRASPAPGTGCLVSGPAPCQCPAPCGPPGRVWANFEWLYWAASGQSLPPLATTAPPGIAQAPGGVPGNLAAAVLFGGQRVNGGFRNGFRLTGGV